MWQEYLNRFFPVNIDTRSDVLTIEDRRPSDGVVLCVALAAGSLFITAVLFRPLSAAGVYWPLALFLLPGLIFGVRSLLLNIREVYVFDKGRDTYTFSRRSVLRRQTAEGSLSQIRAVQLERQVITASGEYLETREIIRVALLLRQELLLGASDTLLLREQTPLGSRYEAEARIAYAIANHLNLPVPEVVNI